MSNEPMVDETIVVNASPLITLGKAKLDYVLPGLFKKIVVPGAVWEEISHYKDRIWETLLTWGQGYSWLLLAF